jgi:catechol 2,3-dioxygenase-like lactoylglutathione lyase family enzyme
MGYLSPTLAVRDMEKTIEFYRDVLGFKLGLVFPEAGNLQTAEYADLSKDGMVVMFIPARNVGIGSEEKLGAGVNFYMEIDGKVDDYYADVKSKGARIAAEIRDEPFGIRDFTTEDVDGYQLTFVNRLQGG